MNQLSWLLYWGNVAENLGDLTVGLVILCGFGTFTAFFCILEGRMESAKKFTVLFPVLGILFATISAFMPSQTTVYAIAASQMGEQALKSPIASKATQALTAWLDKQIAEDKSQ